MTRYKKGSSFDEHFGRIFRNLSVQHMTPLQTDSWAAAADMYETDSDIVIYLDVPGIDQQNLTVTAEQNSVSVSGERKLPILKNTSCVHQLEIDWGRFERTFTLPKPVDVGKATSVYNNGFLVITLPKLKQKGKVRIQVR